MCSKKIALSSVFCALYAAQWVSAGEIQNILCQDNRFTVVAVPNNGESCTLQTQLTNQGQIGAPQTVAVNTSSSIPLQNLQPNTTASVTATLTCNDALQGTQTESSASNSTINGCSNSAVQLPNTIEQQALTEATSDDPTVLRLQNDVRQNCQSLNDPSPACQQARTNLQSVTGSTTFAGESTEQSSEQSIATGRSTVITNGNEVTVTDTQIGNNPSIVINNPADTDDTVTRLQNDILQNCQSLNDPSPACQQARTNLQSVTGNTTFAGESDQTTATATVTTDQGTVTETATGNTANVSVGVDPTIERLENDIRRECTSPTDTSPNCEQARTNLQSVAGRRFTSAGE